MIGFYNYTVCLTYAGLLSAVAGMFFAVNGDLRAAVICLLFSGLCDMFDGKIARTKKDRTDDEKAFGIQIDSLCDIVCFGALPAVICLCVGKDSWLAAAAAGFFVLCGVIRLGYFNVTEETRQKTEGGKRELYTGLPITASAFFVPLLSCFSKRLGDLYPAAMVILLALLGILYISPISIKKPGIWGAAIMLCCGAAVLVLLIM